jgi:hypothetical protein
MLLLERNREPAGGLDPNADAAEALFREARRRRRRRWAMRLFVIAGACALAAALATVVSSDHHRPAASASGGAGELPLGPAVTLGVAGSLAVAPDGALYVTDVARDRVLVRLRDGRFRVVAGNGTVGFAGDGKAAVHAELTDVTDLAFSPSSTLYIADAGRVRAVGRDGVIRTVAGDGRARERITTPTRATSTGLGSFAAIKRSGTPLGITLSTSGQLYISTGSQILRLSTAGELVPVRARVLTPSFLRGGLAGFGPIAIDKHGNIDVSGVNGWAVWQVSPNGIAHQIGSQTLAGSEARRSGGDYSLLERGPGGIVYAENGATTLRVQGKRLVLAYKLGQAVRGEFFWLTYFAFGPHGTLYADEIPGGQAFEARQQLLSVARAGPRLLWEESKATTHLRIRD